MHSCFLVLENWCQRQDKKLYVVSKDSDMKSFCEQSKCLIYLEKASDFTDIVIRSDEQQADFARDLLTRNESRIKEGITKQFEWFGFFIEDQDGDVEDVNVTDIDIDGENLIEVRDGTAKAELRATISFTADLTSMTLTQLAMTVRIRLLYPGDKSRKPFLGRRM